MSTDWGTLILTKLLEWGIPFILGLLLRKKVFRVVIKAKMWLFNDRISITLLSSRIFDCVNMEEITVEIFNDIKTRIPKPQLIDIFPNSMRIKIPTFGILKLTCDKIRPIENPENEENVEGIKLVLEPESPVRLGMRELKVLSDYEKYAEIIFSSVEKLITDYRAPRKNYTIIEAPRFGHFVEEKMYDKEDEEIGTRIQASETKITLIVSPTDKIANAAKKYILT